MTSQNCRILVIDDLPDNLFLLRSLLEDEGYVVDVAEDAISAMALLHSFSPDLILLDVMMPGTNGYELTRKIRRDNVFCAVPIVLITASIEACRVKGLASGATDFVRKPIDVEELLVIIQQLLQRSHRKITPSFSSSYDMN
ncbi:MAG: response regulator [Leptolyngbyaceae cyanobacterium bins.349]|nr:response regulator [Leptolyngbyaceae cyanobacterium bins.349]